MGELLGFKFGQHFYDLGLGTFYEETVLYFQNIFQYSLQLI